MSMNEARGSRQHCLSAAAADRQARIDFARPLDLPTPSTSHEVFMPSIVGMSFVERSCLRCRNEAFITTPPEGPHQEGLQCSVCGPHNGWLSRDKSDDLRRRTAE